MGDSDKKVPAQRRRGNWVYHPSSIRAFFFSWAYKEEMLHQYSFSVDLDPAGRILGTEGEEGKRFGACFG